MRDKILNLVGLADGLLTFPAAQVANEGIPETDPNETLQVNNQRFDCWPIARGFHEFQPGTEWHGTPRKMCDLWTLGTEFIQFMESFFFIFGRISRVLAFWPVARLIREQKVENVRFVGTVRFDQAAGQRVRSAFFALRQADAGDRLALYQALGGR